jgi:hypothetical protein
MTTWTEASTEIINLARQCIDQWHPDLKDARIGFVFRSEGIKHGDRLTLAQASKVSPKMQVFMDFDFIIWISEEDFTQLTSTQREALIDHELCHCIFYEDDNTAKMRKHDVEEFICIVQRHGMWSIDLLRLQEQMDKPAVRPPEQLGLFPGQPSRGVVATISPEHARVLEQVAEELSEIKESL